jgi:hypothetical protein
MFKKRIRELPVEKCADCVYTALADTLTLNGRVQVEDLISAAAAIVGEAAIAAAGEFDPRRHSYTPGTRIFSTNINGLICGDRSYEDAPANSIIGILRDKLSGSGFTAADFPALRNVFEYFATHSGRREDWGKVPLSVPPQHYPSMMPLRIAYETRAKVDKCMAPIGNDQQQRLLAVTLALARVLYETRDALGHEIATTIALETVNGMSKTAPITDAAVARSAERHHK